MGMVNHKTAGRRTNIIDNQIWSLTCCFINISATIRMVRLRFSLKKAFMDPPTYGSILLCQQMTETGVALVIIVISLIKY